MNIDKIGEALEAAEQHMEHARARVEDVHNDELIRDFYRSRVRLATAIAACRAELDKPAEPVAWMVITRIGVEWVRTLGVTKTGARQIAIERYRNGSDVQHMDPIPLYTHPPQAAGLTVDEFVRIAGDWFNHVSLNMSAGDDSASNPRARLEAAKQAKQ